MLKLVNLCKRFKQADGGLRVIAEQLSLEVMPGETVAILGASGSGKSTLLKTIAGLEALDAGQVWFDSKDITALAPERRRFAVMFQDFALFAHLNVLDNVCFGLIEQGISKAQAREQAQAMLNSFGLTTHSKQRIWTLSGGEQQRVALARALITSPRLLLLDEPFSSLDADLREQLQMEFKERIAKASIPTLLVTHDQDEARSMASRGFQLQAGQLKPLWS